LKSKILNAVASSTGRTRRSTNVVGPLVVSLSAHETAVGLDVAPELHLEVAVADFRA
jgi:NADH:ubiquinone oxidoreductase subunit K